MKGQHYVEIRHPFASYRVRLPSSRRLHAAERSTARRAVFPAGAAELHVLARAAVALRPGDGRLLPGEQLTRRPASYLSV